jgi:hypothetical protein
MSVTVQEMNDALLCDCIKTVYACMAVFTATIHPEVLQTQDAETIRDAAAFLRQHEDKVPTTLMAAAILVIYRASKDRPAITKDELARMLNGAELIAQVIAKEEDVHKALESPSCVN